MNSGNSQFAIRTITLEEDGVSIEYVQPAVDIKANRVQINHVIFIPRGDDYDDEIDELVDSVTYLLNDVLEDLPVLTSVEEAHKRRVRADIDDATDV